MKTLLIALCAALTAGAGHAQNGSRMKPGLWETRTLKVMTDGQNELPQIKAAHEAGRKRMRESLAQMTPEQRKKTEAINRGVSGHSDDPAVLRQCVSAAMAENDGAMWQERDPGCAEPKVSRSGNRVAFEMVCKQGTETVKGEAEITSKLVTVKWQWQVMSGGKRQTTVLENQLKFIGSDCGDLKPHDQVAQEAQAGAAARPTTAGK